MPRNYLQTPIYIVLIIKNDKNIVRPAVGLSEFFLDVLSVLSEIHLVDWISFINSFRKKTDHVWCDGKASYISFS